MNRNERRRTEKAKRTALFSGNGDTLQSVRQALGLATEKLAAGLVDDAEKICRRALGTAPDLADCHFVLGTIEEARGLLQPAVKSYTRATELDPHFFPAHLNLGACLKEIGKFEGAIKAYGNALKLEPNSVIALRNLGSAYVDAGKPEDAVAVYRQVLSLQPGAAEVHNALGHALRRANYPEDGLAHLQKAIDLKPRWANAHVGYARNLQALGRFEESAKALMTAIDIKPDYTPAYSSLSNLRGQFGEAGPLLETIRKLLKTRTLPDGDMASLEFAAGRLAETAETPAAAFEHYLKGNRLIRKQLNPSEKPEAVAFNPKALVMSPDTIAHQARHGDRTEHPVFIVGMPRSGTTLVEQVIASHPQAYGAGELNKMWQIGRGLMDMAGKDGEGERVAAALTPGAIGELATRYLDRLRRDAGPRVLRITDKTPENFYWLGLIKILLPNARIVHCMRDPRDTCLSCFFQNFSKGLVPFSYGLDDLGVFYRKYHQLMAEWNERLAGEIFHVQYEKLVAEPEAHIRKIIDFCGLDWNDACLDFHKTDRTVQTASLWQVRQPIFKSSSGKWRKYEKHLGPLKQALGDLWVD